ncbi:hypothetical protein P9D43_24225 [Neobacillus niacini]|uniref:hypothetical protein n=1 Tax=Neobacillus niacini TaxID=86668 RepID=UPI00052FC60A|nr:hypothetical protein [Neobacillus niacini]KGM44972.1 hypothetical protein NP83_08705 [Neobacillus niacini]MEC1525118.1 hypothetical protein [Neobacillus niacini]
MAYEITNMIIDDDFDSEEYVTAEFIYDQQNYSITFKKADLEIINAWVFKDGTSLPANLSDSMVESIRDDIKERM